MKCPNDSDTNQQEMSNYVAPTDLKNRTGSSNSLFGMSRFEANWRPSWKGHPKLGVLSRSYCKASKIGLECSQYVPFDNFQRKYYLTILWDSQYDFIVGNGRHIGVTTCGHIGNFSCVIKRKGKTLSFNEYLVNTFHSSTLSIKCQSSHFRLCNATVLLRWSLQYSRRWLQFPNNRCSIQSYF